MKQSIRMMVIGGTLIAMQAWGAPGRHLSAHRLLNKCMSHEMNLSRTLSYYEASALCKARLAAMSAAPRPTVAAAFPPKIARVGGGS